MIFNSKGLLLTFKWVYPSISSFKTWLLSIFSISNNQSWYDAEIDFRLFVLQRKLILKIFFHNTIAKSFKNMISISKFNIILVDKIIKMFILTNSILLFYRYLFQLNKLKHKDVFGWPNGNIWQFYSFNCNYKNGQSRMISMESMHLAISI